MDAQTEALAEALRRWHEAPSAEVIDLAAERQRRAKNWLLKHDRKPRQPTPPEAA